MKKHLIILAALMLAMPLMGGSKLLYAGALSDLSEDTLKKLSDDQQKAPASPFAQRGISAAADLAIEDLVLSGVAMNQNRAYALISGYIVEKGDKIAGFLVENIEKGRVVLRRLDEVYTLSMGRF